ncbi:MAG: hypothetical protein PHV02_21150 [Rhodocyclaceae bacterium]|nr:hypothetical protein [Rhodocyclaceae bacterium]
MIDPDDRNAELAAIAAESIAWLPLAENAYLNERDQGEFALTRRLKGQTGQPTDF